LFLVSREITSPRETEDGPPEGEARFRIFFERSADAMSLLDPHTQRFIEVNEAVARLFGAPNRGARLNFSPAERWPERQPDGRLSVEKAREMVQLARKRGPSGVVPQAAEQDRHRPEGSGRVASKELACRRQGEAVVVILGEHTHRCKRAFALDLKYSAVKIDAALNDYETETGAWTVMGVTAAMKGAK
jgi:PAS domain-containing protein